MSLSGADAAYFQQQYEALRREALGPRGSLERGHGLALFLSRGMVAWMAALSALGPPRLTPSGKSQRSSPPHSSEFAVELRSDLTTLLAGMVLACHGGREHE